MTQRQEGNINRVFSVVILDFYAASEIIGKDSRQ